jgi:hypothetical protein
MYLSTLEKLPLWYRTRGMRITRIVGIPKSIAFYSIGREVGLHQIRFSISQSKGGNLRPGYSFINDTTTGVTKDDTKIEPVPD